MQHVYASWHHFLIEFGRFGAPRWELEWDKIGQKSIQKAISKNESKSWDFLCNVHFIKYIVPLFKSLFLTS